MAMFERNVFVFSVETDSRLAQVPTRNQERMFLEVNHRPFQMGCSGGGAPRPMPLKSAVVHL